MEDLWNEICFIIDRHRQAASAELYFQIEVENIFEKLGWSRAKGEIITQKSINVGSAHSVRPDIIISNTKNHLFVVELKKPTAGFADRNEDQLFSYMRLLRLNYGILLGDSIRIFYDDPADDKNPIEVISVPFVSNNQDGIHLLDIIKNEGFSIQRLSDYCAEQIHSMEEKQAVERQIQLFCSSDGKKLITDSVKRCIAEAHSEQIAKSVVEALEFSARRKDEGISSETALPSKDWGAQSVSSNQPYYRHQNREQYEKYSWDPNAKVDALELHKRDGESFQDYVRRTMQLAFSNHMLDSAEIENLQSLSYSKSTFGLQYPLLVHGRDKIKDRCGHNRYWTKPVSGNYYCCNDWWLPKIPNHAKLFTEWVKKINSMNSSDGNANSKSDAI